MLRTGYGVPGAAQRGPGTRQCVPGSLCQLLHTCYQATDTGYSIPGTGSGTPGTTCYTPSAVHRAPLTGITHHAPGARYQELASAVPGATYQVLGAMRCALHNAAVHQAAGSQHRHSTVGTAPWAQCSVWHRYQHQVLHTGHCTWAAGAGHCSPGTRYRASWHHVPALALHSGTGYRTPDPAHPAAAPGSPLGLLFRAPPLLA